MTAIRQEAMEMMEKIPENRAISAMKEASRIAEENGISNMTLEEINEEITESRKKSKP